LSENPTKLEYQRKARHKWNYRKWKKETQWYCQ